MTPRLRTALLWAIVLIVLIPAFDLLPRINQLSAWLVNSSTSLFSPSRLQHIDGIAIDKEDELKYHIDGVTYFTPTHAPVQAFPFVHFANSLSKEQQGYFPLTVLRLPLNKVVLDYTVISSVINEYLSMDDVLTPAWLENLVLLPNDTFPGETSTITFIDKETFARLGQDYNVKRIFVDPSYTLPRTVGVVGTGTEIDRIIPPSHPYGYLCGPYLGSVNKDTNKVELWPVYRLYSDTYRTFLFGLYKPLPYDDDPQYQAFREVDERGYNLIPVPSRLSAGYKRNGKGPLRIGVKDLYDVKGVPTSAGSRAYGEMYGPANQTAVSLRLLDPEMGVFVGKTKTTAFAARAFGHEDHVDEQLPFSPRGDGWQNCMGSSSGSACAMAAYNWLDIALGTDTGGSVRMPTAVIGLYGNRVTPGTIPLENVVPYWEYADAAGVVARDPKIFVDFITAWSSLSNSQQAPAAMVESLARPLPQQPSSLLVATDYLTQTNPSAQQVVDEWLMTVCDTLGLTTNKIILDRVLEDAGYTPDSIERFRTAKVESANWWSWSKVGKQFLHDYAARHEGREPGLDPGIRTGWREARKSGSWEKYKANAKQFIEFQEWFANNIFAENKSHCSNQILISSMGIGGWPTYREVALNQDVPPRRTQFEGRDLCTFAGCADYIIPIGQVPYFSKVSNVVEQQAVTISLIANRHCDSVLLKFVETLAEAGLIGTVQTGRTAF